MCHLITSRIKVIRNVIDIDKVFVDVLILSETSTNTLENCGDGFVTTDEEDVEYLVNTDTC